MSDPFGNVEFTEGSTTLIPDTTNDYSDAKKGETMDSALETSNQGINFDSGNGLKPSVDSLLGNIEGAGDFTSVPASSQEFASHTDNVYGDDKNEDFDPVTTDDMVSQSNVQQNEDLFDVAEPEPESVEEPSPSFSDEDEDISSPASEPLTRFDTNEATPPPSPPPTPVEQDPPSSEAEPVNAPVVSSPVVDTTTTNLSPDDGPVKMPKATTISSPTKAHRSSNSSGKCMSAWLKQLDPRVSDILLWRDPRVTGAVLAATLLVLLSISRCSIFSVVSYLLLLTMLGTISIRIIKIILVKVHKGDDVHPFKDILDADIVLSEQTIEEYAQAFVQKLNPFLSSLRALIFVEDFISSLKFCFVLYTLTYIGAWLNGLTIVIIATVGAFTLPKTYEVNKSQVDQYVDVAMSKFEDYYKQLEDKIPYLKKQKTQ